MKKLFLLFVMLSIVEASFFSHKIFAGNDPNGWSASDITPKRFIENKSQFDVMAGASHAKVLYGIDWGKTKIFFTNAGVTYRFDNPVKDKNRKKGSPEPKHLANYDLVYMQWENANTNVEVIAEEKTDDYFSFAVGKGENINQVKGFKKLIYKNIYPNIDVEYIFPDGKEGIKYSLILHPGADASQIKMKYSKNVSLDKEGNIRIPTKFGDIIDHAPFTFYADNKSSVIASRFVQAGNTISFSLGNYDNSKTVVLDPWTQTPALANSNGVWECERDGNGNVYIIGGDMPMKLQKYNSAGAIQWTYSTPWDTSNCWIGALATDLAGNSYVTNGSVAVMQKINTSGGLIWNMPGGMYDEYWSLTFNCDQTKLIAGGTRLTGIPNLVGYGCAFNIDLNNGSVLNTLFVASITPCSGMGIDCPNEIRTICSSSNGAAYYLTLDTIGSLNTYSFNSIFTDSNGINFGYKCENFRPNNGNGGISSIKANGVFVYTQNGVTVQKRSLLNGFVLASAQIPGGDTTFSYNKVIVHNSGIDIDSCGNVYIGSTSAVIKYDANLNLLSSVSLPFAVSDVAVNTNGEVIVAGTTGTNTSTSRIGYVQSINMSACLPIDTFCFDSSVVSSFSYDNNGWSLIIETILSGNQLNGTIIAQQKEKCEIEVTDAAGRCIKKENLSFQKGVNSFKIELNNLQSGLYFIRIFDGKTNRQLSRKFVKQ